MDKPIDLEKMLKIALTPTRLTSMKFIRLRKRNGELYSFKLEGTGEREGSSNITIRQENGEVFLEDSVILPEKNWDYEKNIVLLKKAMYEDLGVVAAGAVKDLNYGRWSTGYTLSFKAGIEKAQKALHHYIGIASEVMGEYFKGFREIDLAFSLARERAGE